MWFVTALIVGGLVGALIFWMRGRGMAFKWYEWLMGIIGLALLLFTAQNYFGSQVESEPTAANMFLLVSGLPAVILLVLTGVLTVRHKSTA